MKEEVKNEVCKIDANYIKQKIQQLEQSPVVQELNYLRMIVQNATPVEVIATEEPVVDQDANETE